MKKRFLATISAVCFALTLAGCGNDKNVVVDQTVQTEITLSWWGNDTRSEYTLAAIEEFEKLHPDIKVKCSYSEWSGYEARNQVRMISGTETDVMQINVGWLDQYSPDGEGYYDISALADTVDLSNFSEDVLEYGMRGGKLNAVPIAMNAETMYINKSIYDKYGIDIPKTWDDLFEAAKVMSPDGVYPMAGADKSMWLTLVAYGEQLSGKHFYNENNEITFNAKDFQNMIEFYGKMVNEKVIPLIEDYQKFNLENGKYAGSIGWVSDAMNFYKNVIADGQEVVAADYPVIEGLPSGTGWYAKPATLYAISKNTEHPQEAAILLDYMLNSREMAKYQGIEKGIPISTSARNYLDEIGKLSGLQYEASLVMENNEYISSMNSLIENSALFNDFIDASNLYLFDKATSKEAAERLYEKYCERYDMAK